jgi:hypothetical protein
MDNIEVEVAKDVSHCSCWQAEITCAPGNLCCRHDYFDELKEILFEAARRYGKAVRDHRTASVERQGIYGSAMRVTQAEIDAEAEEGQALRALQEAAREYDSIF